MQYTQLTSREKSKRKSLTEQAKKLVRQTLPIEDRDETSYTCHYKQFYLNVSFSTLHPLMVFYLAQTHTPKNVSKVHTLLNDINLKSVLGSHSLNEHLGCYSFRATHWLETELSETRFLEILDRCSEEAMRAYGRLIIIN